MSLPLVSASASPAANRQAINLAIAEAAKVYLKADQSTLDGVAALVYRKADQASLDTLSGSLGAKADAAGVQLLASTVASRRVDVTRSLSRPGDGPLAFTLVSAPLALGGDNADLPDVPDTALGFGIDGATAQLGAPGILGMRRAVAIEPGRVYRLHAAVRRLADVADPSNDTVRIALMPLSQAHLPLLSGPIVIADLTALRTTNGRQLIEAGIARSAGPNITVVVPSGTAYVRAYVQSFGATGLTSIEVLDVEDVTTAILLPPVSSDVVARVGALESENLAGRLAAVESQIGSPRALVFSAVSDAAASHIDQGIQIVQTLGNGSAGDGRVHWFRRVTSAPAAGLSFTDQDGQVWAEADQSVDPGFLFSSNVQGTGLHGMDGQSFFIFREVTAPAVNILTETVGRFQLKANYTGGEFGTTRKALWAYAAAEAGCTDFIWSFLASCENNSNAGQNVAAYHQVIKKALGPSFAAVSEAIDTTGVNDPTTGLIGHEIDVVANGTDLNHNRRGLHIVARRPAGSTGAACVVGYGVVVDASTDQSARFREAFAAVGDIEIGLNLQGANIIDSAIKLPASGKIAMEATGQRTLAYEPDVGFVYRISGTPGLRIDDNATFYVTRLALEPTAERMLAYEVDAGLVYRVNGDVAFRVDENSTAFVSQISLDPTGGRTLAYEGGGGLAYRGGGELLFGIGDDGSGTLAGGLSFGPGNRLNFSGDAQRGSTNPVLGASKPGTTSGSAPAIWIAVTIDGSQCWIPAWAS